MADSPARATPRQCHCCGENRQLSFLYRKRGYAIIRCQVCGLKYVDKIPSRDELVHLYSEAFFSVGQKFSGHHGSAGLVNAQQRVEAVRRLPSVGRKRWLDVGCAIGDFLICAETVVDDVAGIELSAFAAGQARMRGVTVTSGDFLTVEVSQASFDVVSMWDYLEHVPNPTATLSKAFEVLKPGGYLALSTGDADSLLARLAGRFWHLMIPPRHLYFFSPATIRRLLTTAGLDVVEIGKPAKRVPLDFAVWKLADIMIPRVSTHILRGGERLRLGSIAPRVNLFDIMTVFARKPEHPEPVHDSNTSA